MMIRSSLPQRDIEDPASAELEDTHLRGRLLVFARVGWVLVTLTSIGLNIIALPDTYGSYFTFDPQMLRDLHQLGLSPSLYSILLTAENAPVQLVNLGLGLWLFLRRSDDRMALLCAFALVTFGNMTPLYNFADGSIAPTLQVNPVLRVLTLTLFAAGETSLVVFFYLFPSGRFAPRWTRWGAALTAIYWLATVFFPALPSNAGGPASFLVLVFLLGAAVAQIYRYRYISTPVERQQTKWVVFGFALAMLILVIGVPASVLLVPQPLQNDTTLQNLNPVFQLAFLLIPLFIALAVMRARLWDIDTLINRTLVYGTLTALLAAVYAGLIIGLESMAKAIDSQASQQPLALVVSTLAIAALFQPARKRIQNGIDRRFYRRKYDAEKTLAAFTASLRQQVELEQLRAQLVTVVWETTQPTHVTLWLAQPRSQPPHADVYLAPVMRT